MPTPTITKHSTRSAVGLTDKGKAYAILLQVRDRYDSLSPSQQAEVADLVARLSQAMRTETRDSPVSVPRVRVPLAARLSA